MQENYKHLAKNIISITNAAKQRRTTSNNGLPRKSVVTDSDIPCDTMQFQVPYFSVADSSLTYTYVNARKTVL